MGHKVNPQIYRLGASQGWSYQLSARQGISSIFIHRLVHAVFLKYTLPHFSWTSRRNKPHDIQGVRLLGEKQIYPSTILESGLILADLRFGLQGHRFHLSASVLDLIMEDYRPRCFFPRGAPLLRAPAKSLSKPLVERVLRAPRKLSRKPKKRAALYFYIRRKKSPRKWRHLSSLLRPNPRGSSLVPRPVTKQSLATYQALLFLRNKAFRNRKYRRHRPSLSSKGRMRRHLNRRRMRRIRLKQRRRKRVARSKRRFKRRLRKRLKTLRVSRKIFRRKRFPLWLINFSPWRILKYFHLGRKWRLLKYFLRLYPLSFYFPRKKKLFFHLILWQLIGSLSFIHSRLIPSRKRKVHPLARFSTTPAFNSKGYYRRLRRFGKKWRKRRPRRHKRYRRLPFFILEDTRKKWRGGKRGRPFHRGRHYPSKFSPYGRRNANPKRISPAQGFPKFKLKRTKFKRPKPSRIRFNSRARIKYFLSLVKPRVVLSTILKKPRKAKKLAKNQKKLLKGLRQKYLQGVKKLFKEDILRALRRRLRFRRKVSRGAYVRLFSLLRRSTLALGLGRRKGLSKFLTALRPSKSQAQRRLRKNLGRPKRKAKAMKFRPFSRVRNNVLLKIFSFYSYIHFFFALYSRFLKSLSARHVMSHRFLFFRNLTKWFSLSLQRFVKFSQFTFSLAGLNRYNITPGLLLNYLIIKLGQYFPLSAIVRPLLRHLRRDPTIRGFRLVASGRLTRKERAAFTVRIIGSMPFSRRMDTIDYAMGVTKTRFGAVGLKVFLRKKRSRFPIYHLLFHQRNIPAL